MRYVLLVNDPCSYICCIIASLTPAQIHLPLPRRDALGLGSPQPTMSLILSRDKQNHNSNMSKDDLDERRLFVGGIKGKGWNNTKIKDLFLVFGSVEEVSLGKEGTAFVVFKSAKDAKEAVENMNGAEFEGAFLRVEQAKVQNEFVSFKSQAVWGKTGEVS
jgi:RNA recognition motif-containing protein